MIQGIILAAGLSTRMGKPKLSIRLQGTTILSLVVQAALDSSLHRVILVTGPGGAVVTGVSMSSTAAVRLQTVSNAHPREGMSSSLRVGMAAVDPNSQGVMVILADQPWLTHTVIDDLASAFMRDDGKIVVPTIRGRRTTPVVFPADLFDELKAQSGDVGGRNVVVRNLDRVVEREMGAYYDDADVDTPEDLKRAEQITSDEESRRRPRDGI
ncbi:MAG: nucleotidyltransferase family protein [Pseudomonadota bacterium]